MKQSVLLILALATTAILTGCEHEHWRHHDDRGTVGPAYEYGHGRAYEVVPAQPPVVVEPRHRDWDDDHR